MSIHTSILSRKSFCNKVLTHKNWTCIVKDRLTLINIHCTALVSQSRRESQWNYEQLYLNYDTWEINFNDVEEAYVFLIKLRVTLQGTHLRNVFDSFYPRLEWFFVQHLTRLTTKTSSVQGYVVTTVMVPTWPFLVPRAGLCLCSYADCASSTQLHWHWLQPMTLPLKHFQELI